MPTLRRAPAVSSEVVTAPSAMTCKPVVRGTRIPSARILAHLRAGRANREIFEDFQTLPIDGIAAATRWAVDFPNHPTCFQLACDGTPP